MPGDLRLMFIGMAMRTISPLLPSAGPPPPLFIGFAHRSLPLATLPLSSCPPVPKYHADSLMRPYSRLKSLRRQSGLASLPSSPYLPFLCISSSASFVVSCDSFLAFRATACVPSSRLFLYLNRPRDSTESRPRRTSSPFLGSRPLPRLGPDESSTLPAPRVPSSFLQTSLSMLKV